MKLAKLTVHAGPHVRMHCPVEAEVELETIPENLILWDEADGRALPVQAWQDGGKSHVAWIVGWMDAGESREYTLRDGSPLWCDGREGRKSLALIRAIYESAQNGEKLVTFGGW